MQELLTKSESLEISCMIQKETFDEEIARRDTYEDKMKEKVDALDNQNRGLKEELSAYLPLTFSLRGFVSSMEQHIFPLATHHIHRKQVTLTEFYRDVFSRATHLTSNHTLPASISGSSAAISPEHEQCISFRKF